MLVLTARQWLDVANWEASPDARQQMTERVGADKTDEFIGMMHRIATNILYTLDTIKISEETMAKFILFVTAVALDNSLTQERGTDA